MNAQEKLKQLYDKLIEKQKKEFELSDLNSEITQLQGEAFELMEDEGVGAIEIEGITFKPKVEQTFTLNTDKPNTRWDSFPDWFAWLKKVGEDGLIKTKESVHHASRNKFLGDWVKKGNELPDFINESFFSTIKYNKSAIKRTARAEIDQRADL